MNATDDGRKAVGGCVATEGRRGRLSLGIVKSGRKHSTLSEKPTQALDGKRAAESSSQPLSRNYGFDTDRLKR